MELISSEIRKSLRAIKRLKCFVFYCGGNDDDCTPTEPVENKKEDTSQEDTIPGDVLQTLSVDEAKLLRCVLNLVKGDTVYRHGCENRQAIFQATGLNSDTQGKIFAGLIKKDLLYYRTPGEWLELNPVLRANEGMKPFPFATDAQMKYFESQIGANYDLLKEISKTPVQIISNDTLKGIKDLRSNINYDDVVNAYKSLDRFQQTYGSCVNDPEKMEERVRAIPIETLISLNNHAAIRFLCYILENMDDEGLYHSNDKSRKEIKEKYQWDYNTQDIIIMGLLNKNTIKAMGDNKFALGDGFYNDLEKVNPKAPISANEDIKIYLAQGVYLTIEKQ